ncbi:MAG: peptide chain release factor-like protein [Deltaproteobacteria bacterium]|nr:peptide chain release factor-like protein [Deltaproteobacteria bacterium]
MPNFPVSPAKQLALSESMKQYNVHEADLEENFIRGSGSGGQKINKTSSCVQLLHLPSGIEVRCQATRSQAMNRFFARRLLVEKIANIVEGKKSAEQQRFEKIRRQKRRRSKRAKEKMLGEKKHVSKKIQRRRVSENDF